MATLIPVGSHFNKRVIILISIAIAFTLLKLWLVSSFQVTSYGAAYHDDRLFANQAYYLLKGQWLGPYNDVTLIKGPFYPMWIAAMYLLGLPLLTSQQLLYIISCIICIIAIRPIVSKPIMLFFAYIFLLYNPISFTNFVMTRIYREGIYPSLTLIVIATFVGFVLRRNVTSKIKVLWAAGMGGGLSAFWLTREEGIWLLPIIVVVYLIILYEVWQLYRNAVKNKRATWKKEITIALVPILIWSGSILIINTINKKEYGVFREVELSSSNFVKAYSSLTRIRHENWYPTVPVPTEVRMRAYEVSPAFAELKPYLEGQNAINWSAYGVGPKDEIKGGWFIFALRNAAVSAGYYSSAVITEKYFANMAAEINNACDTGKLVCGPKRNTVSPPFKKEYIQPLIKTSYQTGIFLTTFKGLQPYSSLGSGTEEEKEFMYEIANAKPYPEDYLTLTGWAFSQTGNVQLNVIEKDGKLANAQVQLYSSPDVYTYFQSRGIDTPYTKEARFSIKTNCLSGCYLQIKQNNEILLKELIDANLIKLKTDKINFHIESMQQHHSDLSDSINSAKRKIMTAIGSVYHYFSPILFGIALLLLIFMMLYMRKHHHLIKLWLMLFAIITIMAIRIGLVAFLDISSFPAISTAYLSAGYPVMLFFIILTLIVSYPVATSFIKNSALLKRKAQ